MTVKELAARFPEVPSDLHRESFLACFAETFDGLLKVARKPSACSTHHDEANHYYMKLIGPLSIYGYGLSTREKVAGQIGELLDRHTADPDGFAVSLLPEDTAARELKGPGCA